MAGPDSASWTDIALMVMRFGRLDLNLLVGAARAARGNVRSRAAGGALEYESTRDEFGSRQIARVFC